jgi:hypothetical protein
MEPYREKVRCLSPPDDALVRLPGETITVAHRDTRRLVLEMPLLVPTL